MISFNDWCDTNDTVIGAHSIKVLSGRPADLEAGKNALAAEIPSHYASEEHIARNLERLGKIAAAEFIRQKLPTNISIRSGDLGEILATEYIAELTGYSVLIKRLRWKDHRNMAMRGEDVIGIAIDPETNRLRFLKTEAKSRANLVTAVVTEARESLDKENGLPSAHALSFIAARLMELGNIELADAISDAQLKHSIPPQTVKHLLFTYSGNNPTNFLNSGIAAYTGSISQSYVGLRIQAHGDFINSVYVKVIENASDD